MHSGEREASSPNGRSAYHSGGPSPDRGQSNKAQRFLRPRPSGPGYAIWRTRHECAQAVTSPLGLVGGSSPPGSRMRTDVFRSLTNSAHFAGIFAGSNAGHSVSGAAQVAIASILPPPHAHPMQLETQTRSVMRATPARSSGCSAACFA